MAEADAFAHDMLERADISPKALGDMFEAMRQKHGDSDGLAAHFLSHPALAERIDAARGAVDKGRSYESAMSTADWNELRNICN